jgi:membrane protease YdiL (CAAX protease family)
VTQNKAKRNIVIYVIGVLLLATVGGLLTSTTGSDVGGLLFILGPILMMTLLRFMGGDGWQDAGLRLNLKAAWRWYLFSLLAYPVTIALVIVLGVILGVTTVAGDWDTLFASLLVGVAAQLIPRMLFALFEEWGWRGYLEPRLAALNVPDLPRHLFVGLIWALWHFPLILSTDYTTIPYLIFLPMFTIGVVVAAIVYGQIRKHSGTVWTAVLLHGVGNTVAWAILQSNLVTIQNKVLANFTPESLLVILIWGALGWWLLSSRKVARTGSGVSVHGR